MAIYHVRNLCAQAGAFLSAMVMVIFVSSGSSKVLAQSIDRGPYLQQGAPTSMIVRWRTDTNVSTHLEYGLSPTYLSNSSEVTKFSKEHEVVLTSLKPGTRYYYRVVARGAVLSGGDGLHYFVTSPSGGDEPISAWIVGDAGTSGTARSGEDPNQAAVRDAFLKKHPTGTFQLFLMLGDNAYQTGTDSEYQKAVFDAYQQVMRSTVAWPTQGNHDYTSNAYYRVFSLPSRGESGGTPSGTEYYYSFDYGNVHFICLNSEVIDRTFRASMIAWLREDLAAHDKEWTVAFWHHPPYTKGHHDSDVPHDSGGRLMWMRENILPILEASGVDLVLTGHSHSYERSKFIDGHYKDSSTFSDRNVVIAGDGHDEANRPYEKSGMGKIAHSGAVYVVAGNGGSVQPSLLVHPAMIISLAKLGSMMLSIDSNELTATMIGAEGATEDYFTIRKDPRRPRGVKNIKGNVASSGCSVDLSWDNDSNARSYTIYRSANNDSRGVKVGDVPAHTGTFKDSIKELGAGEYLYSVRAQNDAGSGPWGASVRVIVPQHDKCR